MPEIEELLENQPIVLFDGVCNFCSSVATFAIERDSGEKLKFAPLQSEKGEEILEHFGMRTEGYKTFVLLENGRAYTRSTAAVKLLEKLSFPWKWIGKMLKVIPEPVRDLGYRLVAKSRYSIFGKKDSCMVPGEEVKERFL